MDLWAVNLRSAGGGGCGVGISSSSAAKSRLSAWGSLLRRAGEGGGRGGIVQIGFSVGKGREACEHRSFEVKAIGKNKRKNNGGSSSSGSNDHSIPERDDSETNNSELDKAQSDSSHRTYLDWRTFRANLVAREQVPPDYSEADADVETASHEPSARVGAKWAHPIAMPETGCVLVATEKLDGVRNFERTVVLLLRLGTRDTREGPFGVIINRPLQKKIRHMKPTNADLATTFADCSLHFGGPLDASMFLLRSKESLPPSNFEQVVPGICFGARNSLDEASGLVKKGILRPEDFRFFVGYAGWQFDQLIEEIESEYWVVAACSSDLISYVSEDSSGLWEEILQLMGGEYSELSRKPRQDGL